jgi:hypothetical protein
MRVKDIPRDEPVSEEKQKEAVKEEQNGLSYKEVRDLMRSRNEYLFEMDKLRPQLHRWIDRGENMTCEGGDHPYHVAWKRR